MKNFSKAIAITLINLQLFAEAGTLVNATGSYVNAYDGNTTAFSGTNTLSGELKTFYDTELLENARIEMFYAQFAKRQPLPKGRGKTCEWRKWNTFDKASQLAEGVIPTGQKFGMSSKTGSISQYGTYASVSDVLEMRAYDDVILGATEEMGASMAETQETLIRDALYTNTNVLYCDNITLSSGAVENTPDAAYKMKSGTSICSILTPDMVAKAVTKLKKDRVPTINGKYYAVIHPSVAYDLRKSKEWIEAHKYAAAEELFNGEIGELHGCRFIENVFAPIIRDQKYAGAKLSAAVTAAATTSISFTGATVVADALIGMYVYFGTNRAKITDNTANSITFASFTAAAVASGTDIYISDGDGIESGEATYATYFFGKDAFGIIDPDGGAAEMIVKSKEQVGGPLNQFSTIGYKLETNGATMLYTERVLRVMSCSAYSGIDTSN